MCRSPLTKFSVDKTREYLQYVHGCEPPAMIVTVFGKIHNSCKLRWVLHSATPAIPENTSQQSKARKQNSGTVRVLFGETWRNSTEKRVGFLLFSRAHSWHFWGFSCRNVLVPHVFIPHCDTWLSIDRLICTSVRTAFTIIPKEKPKKNVRPTSQACSVQLPSCDIRPVSHLGEVIWLELCCCFCHSNKKKSQASRKVFRRVDSSKANHTFIIDFFQTCMESYQDVNTPVKSCRCSDVHFFVHE